MKSFSCTRCVPLCRERVFCAPDAYLQPQEHAVFSYHVREVAPTLPLCSGAHTPRHLRLVMPTSLHYRLSCISMFTLQVEYTSQYVTEEITNPYQKLLLRN